MCGGCEMTRGKVIDLEEYRRRMALDRAEGRTVRPAPEEPRCPEEEREWPAAGELPEEPDQSRERRAWTLDACASLGVIVMTLAFALRVFLL